MSLIATTSIHLIFSLFFGIIFYNSGPWSYDNDEDSFKSYHNRIGILFIFILGIWQTAILSAELIGLF